MGTINSALNSYYQLSNLQSGTSGSSGTGTVANLTASLLAALDSSSTDSNSDNAYSLNLSDAAQQLLSGTSSDSSTGTSSTNFVLSDAQQKTITSILEKYKNAPMTQATFNSIQSDLQAAGLGSDTLAAEDSASSFNSTSILLSALSGNYTSLSSSSATSSSEETKSSNYMESILAQWQSISTAASASTAAATTSAGSSITV